MSNLDPQIVLYADRSMTDFQTNHIPVMVNEILEWLAVQPNQTIVDGTFGGGGHASEIARRLGEKGLLIGCDRDPKVLENSLENPRFTGLPIKLAHSSYVEIPTILQELNVDRVDGILLDLGLSSDQLGDRDRGFSYTAEGPLDLRFNPEGGEPAWRMIQRLSVEHLANVIYEYGEERFSRRIARAMVKCRKTNPIRSAKQLADLILRVTPTKKQRNKIHPATRTFQALRIAVNEELLHLERALKHLPEVLCPSGKIAIISFHSLEDRMVKNAFRDDLRLQVLTKKPVLPGEAEIMQNPRARSAKLRIAERVAQLK